MSLVTRRNILGLLGGIPLTSICIREGGAAPFPALDPEVAYEIQPYSPVLLTRAQWRAKPPFPGMKPQIPRAIIIHHTAVRQNPSISLERKMRGLQSFSQKPGQVSPKVLKPAWPDVPYHYY